MKRTLILLVTLLFVQPLSPTHAQIPGVSSPEPTILASGDAVLSEAPDRDDDPAHALYKEGYHLILDEQWSEAQHTLNKVVEKYPKSQYIDDAKYWIAYALMHVDQKKARAEYKKFIKEYPKSKYIDDAVADLGELDESSAVTITSIGDSNVVFKRLPGGYAYGIGTTLHLADEQLKRSERQLRRQLEHLGRPITPIPPIAPVALPHRLFMPGSPRDDESLDEETRLKMKALYALGETRGDEKAFTALREVALDMKEDRPLREAALDALSQFTKFDVLPVYIEIAKRDTSEDLQNYAVDYISNSGKDKEKSVQTLVDLFRVLPKNRIEQRTTIFFAIAEIGNDRAVDFLVTVAKTNDDYDLRSEAVFYLGCIGGEKGRSALYDIIREKKER